MTREEAIKILSILKAAYPNSYKGMTIEEANGTINIWATQFSNVPLNIVSIAINKLISTNTFPPSISEVKGKIKSLYWEAWVLLNQDCWGESLPEKTVKQLQQILDVCSSLKDSTEPTLTELIRFEENKALPNGNNKVT